MEYKLKINGEETSVEAEGEDNSFSAKIGEKSYQVSCVGISQNMMHLTIDEGGASRGINVYLGGAPGAKQIVIGGVGYSVEDADAVSQKRAGGGAGELPDTVTPPMPAVVIAINVEVGDEVKKGQSVMVVSAMKMEVALASPYDGKVTAINTAVGEKASPGDILIDIEKDEAAEE